MPQTGQTTHITGSISVGTRVLRGLLGIVGAGSLFVTGLYFGGGSARPVQIFAGSGQVLTYSGANLTGTGGLPKYTLAYIRNPYTGTGVLHRLHVETEVSERAAKIDCGIVSSLSNSGETIINNNTTASGQILIRSTGSFLIPPGRFIKCASGVNTGKLRGQLKVWMSEYWAP